MFKIIDGIAKLRDEYGNVHRVCSVRIEVDYNTAQLSINAAITISEYLLGLI